MGGIDEVLEQIGTFGWYQRRNYLHLTYTWVVTAAVTLCFVFISPTDVEWRCADDGGTDDTGAGRNGTLCPDGGPWRGASGTAVLCDTADGALYRDRTAWEFVNPGHTVTAEFGLVCNESWKAPLLAGDRRPARLPFRNRTRTDRPAPRARPPTRPRCTLPGSRRAQLCSGPCATGSAANGAR